MMGVLLVLLVSFFTVFVNSWTADFPYTFVVDDATQFKFHWQADTTLNTMRVGLEINSVGWIGFGISPEGGMPNSDVFISYILGDGTPVLEDRKVGATRALPALDSAVAGGNDHDWTVLGSSRVGNYMNIEAIRNFVTGDARDLPFVTGMMKLVFAHYVGNPDDAGFLPLKRHTIRFQVGLTLIGTPALGDPNAVDTTGFPPYTVRSIRLPNASIPVQQTTYHCIGTTLVATNETLGAHAIAFQPVIVQNQHVHHMILYGCQGDMSGGDQPFECSSMPYSCLSLMWAWAMGGKTFYPPSTVGFLYGLAPFKYVVLQVHYDNTGLFENRWDNSGLNIYYTDVRRPLNGGFLPLAVSLGRTVLPPGKPAYKITNVCDTNPGDIGIPCAAIIPSAPFPGFNVFASFLHAHKLGRQISSYKTLPNGTLQSFGEKLNFDFTLQDIISFNPPRLLSKGDTITTSCTFDTTSQDHTVIGGESTADEMCMNFLAYYPYTPSIPGLTGKTTYDETPVTSAMAINASIGGQLNAAVALVGQPIGVIAGLQFVNASTTPPTPLPGPFDGTITFKLASGPLFTPATAFNVKPVSTPGLYQVGTSIPAVGNYQITAVYVPGVRNVLQCGSTPALFPIPQFLPNPYAPINIVVKTTTNVVITGATPAHPLIGQVVTITAQINQANPAPLLGSIAFSNNGVVFATISTIDGVNTYSTTITFDSIGDYAITAQFTPANNAFVLGSPVSSPLSLHVKAPTSVSITNTDPSGAVLAGQPVTYTIQVTSPGGTPTGTVTLTPGGTTVLSGGQATTTVSFTVAGLNTLTVVYDESNDFVTSSTSQTKVVNAASTTTTVTASSYSGVVGQILTIPVTVTPQSPSQGPALGKVSFSPINVDVDVIGGVAVLQYAWANYGTINLQAVYVPSVTGYLTSQLNYARSVTINQASTTLTLTTNNAAPVIGQTVEFTATVTASSPGAGVPTGTISFNNAVTGTVALNAAGVAKITKVITDTWATTVGAGFNSDNGNYGYSGATLQFTPVKAQTQTVLSASTSSVVVGQTVDFTLTVSVIAPGGGVPDGGFSIPAINAYPSLSTANNGVVTVTNKRIESTTPIVANFNHYNGRYENSVSNSIVPGKAITAITTNLPATLPVGSAIVFDAWIANVAPSTGFPASQQVTLTVSPPLSFTPLTTWGFSTSNGKASFNSYNNKINTAGVYTFTISYPASANYFGATLSQDVVVA